MNTWTKTLAEELGGVLPHPVLTAFPDRAEPATGEVFFLVSLHSVKARPAGLGDGLGLLCEIVSQIAACAPTAEGSRAAARLLPAALPNVPLQALSTEFDRETGRFVTPVRFSQTAILPPEQIPLPDEEIILDWKGELFVATQS